MGNDRRLAWLLGVDIATTAVGVVVLLGAHFFVVASGYFLVLAAMVAAAGLDHGVRLSTAARRPSRPCRRRPRRRQLSDRPGGDGDRPVRDADPAPRHDAPGGAGRALRLAAPAPWLRRRPRSSTALGVAALGSLQDVTGFRDVLPWWLESGVVIFFIPFMASMVSIIALTNATVLAENVVALRASRARVVASAERERRRIERDLHDGAQQALVTAKVQLANLRQDATRVDATLGSRFDELRDQLRRASVELRDLARGVHPMALQEGGLGSALRHAVASFPGDATVEIRTARRFDPDVERAVYFCLTEALQNAFKHGGAGFTCDSSSTATSPRCASPSATTGPDSIRRQPRSAPGSTTWSIGSARSAGNSPSVPRSVAARGSPARCRPARFLPPATSLNSGQRYLATRAGQSGTSPVRSPTVELSTEVGAGST